jgi:hypothetical protein
MAKSASGHPETAASRLFIHLLKNLRTVAKAVVRSLCVVSQAAFTGRRYRVRKRLPSSRLYVAIIGHLYSCGNVVV